MTADELARAARGEVIVDRAIAGVGEHARLLARPMRGPVGEEVVGVVATSTASLAEARERLTIVLGVAGPVLAAAIGAAAWFLTGAALRPVRRMSNEAATISMAEPGRRLAQPAGDDEIAELGRTLNAMLARIETTIAHERAFIDDAAHELRSPLAVLRGELELTADDPRTPTAVAQGRGQRARGDRPAGPPDRGPAHAGPCRRRPARSRRGEDGAARRRRGVPPPPAPSRRRAASRCQGSP